MSRSDWEESVMGVVLHWFLPTNGDSRTNLSLGQIARAGVSAAALDVAARHADVYLTWGEPPTPRPDGAARAHRLVTGGLP